MRFCPDCDNILIPRKKKLFCKACDKEFGLNKDQERDYIIVKNIPHEKEEIAPIIIKDGLKSSRISPSDRKAFEEFFSSSPNGY